MSDKFLEGLKEMVHFFEDNPTFPRPEGTDTFWILARDKTKEEAAELIRMLGKTRKEYTGHDVDFRKDFGYFELGLCINRELVCTKRVIGTRRVEEILIPAREEEIIEWDCGGSILVPTNEKLEQEVVSEQP